MNTVQCTFTARRAKCHAHLNVPNTSSLLIFKLFTRAHGATLCLVPLYVLSLDVCLSVLIRYCVKTVKDIVEILSQRVRS